MQATGFKVRGAGGYPPAGMWHCPSTLKHVGLRRTPIKTACTFPFYVSIRFSACDSFTIGIHLLKAFFFFFLAYRPPPLVLVRLERLD